jgi:hypothetical protein
MPRHSLVLAQATRPICIFSYLADILTITLDSNQHNFEVRLPAPRELKNELCRDGPHVHISKQLNGKRNPPHPVTSIPYGKKIPSPCRRQSRAQMEYRTLLRTGPTSASPVHTRLVEFLCSKRSSSACFAGVKDSTTNIVFHGFNMFKLFKCYIVEFNPCCTHI